MRRISNNRLNFSMDYTNPSVGRNSPALFSENNNVFSSNGQRSNHGGGMSAYGSIVANGLMKKIDAGKILRTAAFSNPMSPERIAKADHKFDQSNKIWQLTSKYMKDKVN